MCIYSEKDTALLSFLSMDKYKKEGGLEAKKKL